MTIGSFRAGAIGIALTLAVPAAPAFAAPFDGTWSVTMSTDSGSCPVRRRAVVTVRDGKVTYAGAERVTADGSVGASGRVDVRFVYEGDRLDARGSVKGSIGSGSWTSPTENCQGSWMARKEG
ncbi:hypothetical protein ACUN0C_08865 [Faunimonas sp. B44]|uniref:hypothetical protein n=1 Tax=Faunimonas sp. B44 TaxID=3461493 RepID=UPI0040440007